MISQMLQEMRRRFFLKVNKTETCWLWLGNKNACGYGVFSYANVVEGAHRAGWEISNGAIPAGMQALHRCDIRACVNPAHMFLGTNADNIADKVAKGRQIRGIRSSAAKVTENAVYEIRWLATQGHSRRAIGKEFGIDGSTAGLIVSRQSWGHLPDIIAPNESLENKPDK